MNKRLEKALQDEFPNLYKDLYGPMDKTPMYWGFTCGEGWFVLIWQLSRKLEDMINKWIEEHPDDPNIPRAAQVKEKFGLLRYYMDYGTDKMYNVIHEYENASGEVCEECGMPGRLIKGVWWRTICHRCESNMKKEKGDDK